jgi:hypothetical protein
MPLRAVPAQVVLESAPPEEEVPAMTILFAVPPRPQHKGTLIHLYNPAMHTVHTREGSYETKSVAVCGAVVVFEENRALMKPLHEAADWAGQHNRVDGLPSTVLRWCPLCLGRALSQNHDLVELMIHELARRQEKG